MPEQKTNHLDADLKDAKAPSKWPWVLGGLGLVLIVVLLQLAVKHSFGKIARKVSQTIHVSEEIPEHPMKRLPMPTQPQNVRSEEEKVFKPIALPSRLSDEENLIAKAKLIERLKRQDMHARMEAEMRASSPLVNIGVSSNEGQKQNLPTKADFQNPNTQYLKSVSDKAIPEANASFLGDLRFRVLKGTVIKGVTESAIDSDLPGIIRGHVTEDVYGEQGDFPLIQNGDKLIGEYRSGDLRAGQVRLFVVWTRLVLQNGVTVNLDSGGSDPLGRAGMTGKVDHHFMERNGSAMLMSMIGAGASTVGVNGDDRYNSQAMFRQSITQSLSQTATQELQNSLTIQNTIQPPQGSPITIMVNQDISFEDIYRQGDAT